VGLLGRDGGGLSEGGDQRNNAPFIWALLTLVDVKPADAEPLNQHDFTGYF
jgi:hypothetical protein